jgi:creatinine amidohydrolase/Fe(II)-dependent formamide hydrolase-like protein
MENPMRGVSPGVTVVLVLGAAAKEHGPHLRLDNDLQMAEYLKRRVLDAADVVVATVAKGRTVVEATVEGILEDIEELRGAELPSSIETGDQGRFD